MGTPFLMRDCQLAEGLGAMELYDQYGNEMNPYPMARARANGKSDDGTPRPTGPVQVTSRDQESFAFFLSDPSCKSLYLSL